MVLGYVRLHFFEQDHPPRKLRKPAHASPAPLPRPSRNDVDQDNHRSITRPVGFLHVSSNLADSEYVTLTYPTRNGEAHYHFNQRQFDKAMKQGSINFTPASNSYQPPPPPQMPERVPFLRQRILLDDIHDQGRPVGHGMGGLTTSHIIHNQESNNSIGIRVQPPSIIVATGSHPQPNINNSSPPNPRSRLRDSGRYPPFPLESTATEHRIHTGNGSHRSSRSSHERGNAQRSGGGTSSAGGLSPHTPLPGYRSHQTSPPSYRSRPSPTTVPTFN